MIFDSQTVIINGADMKTILKYFCLPFGVFCALIILSSFKREVPANPVFHLRVHDLPSDRPQHNCLAVLPMAPGPAILMLQKKWDWSNGSCSSLRVICLTIR